MTAHRPVRTYEHRRFRDRIPRDTATACGEMPNEGFVATELFLVRPVHSYEEANKSLHHLEAHSYG